VLYQLSYLALRPDPSGSAGRFRGRRGGCGAQYV